MQPAGPARPILRGRRGRGGVEANAPLPCGPPGTAQSGGCVGRRAAGPGGGAPGARDCRRRGTPGPGPPQAGVPRLLLVEPGGLRKPQNNYADPSYKKGPGRPGGHSLPARFEPETASLLILWLSVVERGLKGRGLGPGPRAWALWRSQGAGPFPPSSLRRGAESWQGGLRQKRSSGCRGRMFGSCSVSGSEHVRHASRGTARLP